MAETNVIRSSYGENEWHFGELRMPAGAGPHPVALIIHGGFWKAEYGLDLMDKMAEDFTARGWATWNIEYRRYGHEGGAYPGTFLDVGAAADHLRELAQAYPLDLAAVVAIGHSAGGHLALWLAGRHRLPADSELAAASPLALKGVVSLAGVSDMHWMWEVRQEDSPVANFLGGMPAQVPDRYAQTSPVLLLPLGVPQILVHGMEDEWVPFEMSADYLPKALAAGDPVELAALPGVEHFKVIDPASEAWPPIVEAMEKLARR